MKTIGSFLILSNECLINFQLFFKFIFKIYFSFWFWHLVDSAIIWVIWNLKTVILTYLKHFFWKQEVVFSFICQVQFSFDFKDHFESFLQQYAICGESFHGSDFAVERERSETRRRTTGKYHWRWCSDRSSMELTGFNSEYIQQWVKKKNLSPILMIIYTYRYITVEFIGPNYLL